MSLSMIFMALGICLLLWLAFGVLIVKPWYHYKNPDAALEIKTGPAFLILALGLAFLFVSTLV